MFLENFPKFLLPFSIFSEYLFLLFFWTFSLKLCRYKCKKDKEVTAPSFWGDFIIQPTYLKIWHKFVLLILLTGDGSLSFPDFLLGIQGIREIEIGIVFGKNSFSGKCFDYYWYLSYHLLAPGGFYFMAHQVVVNCWFQIFRITERKDAKIF